MNNEDDVLKAENRITEEPIEPEVVSSVPALSRPSIPVNIDQLAAAPDRTGVEVVKNRKEIIETLRRASIMLTSPQDWLLFKTPDGAVTGFCQDSGCKRFWQIWGIEISPRGTFEKIVDDKTGDFAYRCVADGWSNVTGLFVKEVEGVRYSTEDFCKNLPAVKKDVRVRQAAIANRDGNIIRSLSGMKSVAIEVIREAWEGTGKDANLCSKGRGYGSQAERRGATVRDNAPTDIKPPTCACGQPMRFVPGGTSKATGRKYDSFYSCPDYKRGNADHDAIDESEYRKKLEGSKAGSADGSA